ncbi:MAG: HI0074 family nucleotidyltransferase substrate-binding subunit [Oscillospiraceae bacterium]|nr:HI0074 family nucleotidyltransferase substrate-binding subunit [Oscillospiraceae bacterium]
MGNHFTRLEAFKNSLDSLSKINEIVWRDNDVYTRGFIWCGVIAKFSITFDLSWKLMKDILVRYHKIADFAKGSPREVLKKSYETDIINSHTWAEMLDARNEISHQYKDLDSVDDWCVRITERYIPLFNELSEYAEKRLHELT